MKDKASRLRRFKGLRQGRLDTSFDLEGGRRLALVVASQAEVEAGLGLTCPHAVVSMLDPESAGLRAPDEPSRRGLLELRYHDTRRRYDEPNLPPHLVPLDRGQARAICAFVRAHLASVACLVVQCHHGMSRSPSVAAALTRALGGDDGLWHQKKVPNLVIYDLVLEVWNSGAG